MMKKLYIETVGCQMNMLDSELVVAALRKDGYDLVATPTPFCGCSTQWNSLSAARSSPDSIARTSIARLGEGTTGKA